MCVWALVASSGVPSGSRVTSSRCMMNASNTAGFPACIGEVRAASVSRMSRAMPHSRPLGFAATSPPATSDASWRPQQLPQQVAPASISAFAKVICAATRGSSV